MPFKDYKTKNLFVYKYKSNKMIGLFLSVVLKWFLLQETVDLIAVVLVSDD